MSKKNWIIPGVLVLAAVVMLLVTHFAGGTTADENMVIITVNGQEYARIPLSSPQTVTIDQGDGKVNVVEVSDHGAVMLSSTCDNQQCVHMGEVTLDNWEVRANQAFIICLPNRVTVELAVKEE
jgi:hypothetical protein